MDSERWERVQAVFEAALAREPEKRAAYVAGACGDDEAMRDEVISLLAADESAPEFLDGRAADAIDIAEIAEPDDSLVGKTIGPYRLERLIGTGGMGLVLLAVRIDGAFDQRVALKLIKRGMDSATILRRFQSERRILARLQHINIARLLDGGITDDGRPYFTMEYVLGEPIDHYCDNRRLPIEDRLELFRTVCGAIDYAHHALVVHRDIKPNNILVTADGTVKLLDFGIAKVLDPHTDPESPGGHGTLTQAGVRAMTPEYASPEQFAGRPVTTASDVYSLGVILYELLCGRRPHQAAAHDHHELARHVMSSAPAKPSAALMELPGDEARADEMPESRVSARAATPDRLRRRLSGDLDTVCLMALRTEPERRHRSAHHLADDVGRHLAGLPVSARPDTFGYRTRKFLRRHRLSVAMTTAAVVMIAAVIGVYTSLLVRERDRARNEAAKAAQVSQFLTSVFDMADPMATEGESVTVRELLDSAATRINVELRSQPEVQAQMLHVVGRVYHNIGLYDTALPHLERALTIRRALYGDEHADVAATLRQLATLVYERGDYEEAERLDWEVLALDRKLYPGPNETVASDLNNLAAALRHQGDFLGAESLYVQALAMRRQVHGAAHPDVAHTLNHLARLHENRGDNGTAEPLYREALAMRRDLLDDDHIETAASKSALASVLRARGEFAEAERLYRGATATFRQRLGTQHPYAVGALSSLAGAVTSLGRWSEADSLYREVIELHRQGLPVGHVRRAFPLLGYGELLMERGEHEAAETYLREAVQLRRDGLPDGHWQTALAESALGACLAARGQLEEAERLLVGSYESLTITRPAGDPRRQSAQERLADFYESTDRPERAATLRGRSLMPE